MTCARRDGAPNQVHIAGDRKRPPRQERDAERRFKMATRRLQELITMPGRTLLFVVVLVVAVVGPYLLSERGILSGNSAADGAGEPIWKRILAAVNAPPAAGDPTANAAAGSNPNASTLPVNSGAIPSFPELPGRPVPARQIGGPAGISLADALRLDVTPSWVSQNWARVTTQLSDVQYHGLRVPLVTGTEPHDVAGALSYYFNGQEQLERLTLTGYTGDYEPLVALVQSRFGLQQYAAVGTMLFLGYYGNEPVAVLRIGDASLQAADQPNTRYHVELEFNAPRPGARLSAENLAKLQKMRIGKLL